MKGLICSTALSILLLGCATPEHQNRTGDSRMDSRMIIGKTWQWLESVTPAEKIIVSDPERYTLKLTENGRVEARFDCNRGGGSYQITEGKLVFGPMMSTRMACPEDSLDIIYMEHLQAASTFFMANDELYLEMPGNGGALRFRSQP